MVVARGGRLGGQDSGNVQFAIREKCLMIRLNMFRKIIFLFVLNLRAICLCLYLNFGQVVGGADELVTVNN